MEAPLHVTPFSIQIEAEILSDLRERIRKTRWPDQAPGAPWEQGTDLEYLRRLLEYWAGEFDWQAQERELNAATQFRAELDGVHIHFVHERARHGHGVPLILSHGWPSTFVELLPLVPFLTDPHAHGIDGPAFDVVIPSLPGYGFSERPRRTGVNYQYVAGLWHRLMRGLGYERYGAQGGDFGAGISHLYGVEQSQANDWCPSEQSGDCSLHWTRVATAVRSGESLSRAQRGILAGGIRLQGNPVHEASDARIRAKRLAGRACRLDSGKVALLGRFRR